MRIPAAITALVLGLFVTSQITEARSPAKQMPDQEESEYDRAGTKGPESPEDDFDRLDGTGDSGKTVQVIDWEGNMEIHVYPKGSLHALALKIDKKDKNKPVMVIGYRFTDNPQKQLIRRAIITMPLFEGFKAYKDSNEPEFDKIIISNNTLSGLTAYRLDAEPKQMYPDGHPALGEPKKDEKNTAKSGKLKGIPIQRAGQAAPEPAPKKTHDDEGRITPFGMDD